MLLLTRSLKPKTNKMLPFLSLVFLLLQLCHVDGQYNLTEALSKSILFYEAQRSGVLPANNRVPWRGNSCLNDRGTNGEDLTGGWYDAGDNIKFGFPMAFTTTTLAWGILEFASAYRAAGEYNNALSGIRWSLDYFIKCHPQPNLFYGQVGEGAVEHVQRWGRPEDNNFNRPAFALTNTKPGSDLLAETAAAMAASSLVFRSSDANYSKILLSHARQLYAFAYAYRGLYSDSIRDAANFYRSSAYTDELAWGAAWLYRATGERSYLNQALEFVNQYTVAWAFNWEEKTVGAQLLLFANAGKRNFANGVTKFINSWRPGGSVTYTPKGLACAVDWGSLAATGGTSLISLIAAKYGILKAEGRALARSQINYILGSSGHSFVVGFGVNPPRKAHHMAASCPNRPAPCDWDNFNSPNPNPQTLYGAVVGGPTCATEYWVDDRSNYQANEVACDYNAAYQGSLAGLLALGY